MQLLAQGEAGIRQTIARAYELGAVMDEKLIAKADEINRKFSDLGKLTGSVFKQAIVDLARMLGIIREARETMAYNSGTTARVIGSDVSSQLDQLPQVSEGSRAEIEGIAIEYGFLADAALHRAAPV